MENGREGSPTVLTKKLRSRLLGDNTTPGERLAPNAWLPGGIAEYWKGTAEGDAPAVRESAGRLQKRILNPNSACLPLWFP